MPEAAYGMGFEAGQVIGRYRLIEKLGVGAAAEVWKAVETSEVDFSKEVALKIVREEDLHSDEVDDSLLKEAQLCANLRHPNIVDILGVEESDGAVQVAMEFVEGGTLAGLMAKVRGAELLIPHSVILDIGIGICRALHRAHTFSDAQGQVRPIIHRDLKPANILMSRAGVPKVADFGLAKASGETSSTATGTLKGTPAYIAPELWEGGRDFEPGVDLFAVGCILWELVQLKRLFSGVTLPQIYLQVERRDPADEAAECLERFPALVPTIEKLIQRDPEKRYKKASTIINDLQKLRKDSMVSGEIVDFMELMSLTELPEEERKLPHSSQFRIPETTDPVWQAVISEALGEDVPVDPSFGDLPSGEFRGGAASGGHGLPNASPTTAGIAADEAAAYRRSGAAEERTVVVSRSSTEAAAERLTVVEDAAPARRGSYRLGGAVLLALGLALAWFTLGSGGKQNLAGDAADSAASVAGPGASAEATSVASRAENPGDTEGVEVHLSAAEGAVGEPTRNPDPPVAISVPSESTPTRTPISGKGEPKPELKVKPKQDMKPKLEPTSVEPTKKSVGGGTHPPTAVSDKGCLLLTGSPGGLVVWLDGSKQGRRAGRSAMRFRRSPGAVTVGMGMSNSPSVAVTTSLQRGGATAVHCDLVVSQSCTARPADPELCR
jgi:serine/threonine-protein kinase